MATISTMAMLKCYAGAGYVSMAARSTRAPAAAASVPPPARPRGVKPAASLQNFPVRGLALPENYYLRPPPTAAAVAGAIFSALSASDAAFAAQQVADIAEGDNRGLALLLPLIPAVLWVLYNILQPALNQLNRMRSEKSLAIGLGGGLAAAGFLSAPGAAEALQQIADVAESSGGGGSGDGRGLALLLPIVPAILWVLYNILQPALNQINRMRSG